MVITRTGLVALISVCAAAGAGGAYVATRTAVPAAVTSTINGEPVVGLQAQSSSYPDTRQAEAFVPTASPSAGRSAKAAPQGRPGVRPSVAEPTQPTAPVGATRTEPNPAPESPLESRQQAVAAPVNEPVAPTEPDFEELVVNSDVVLGLQVDTTVTSETARVEDEVAAHVTRDVRVGGRVAIPSGATAYGEVVSVERGGRLRERARLGVRFTSILLNDGSRVPIATDVVFREGNSASRESAAKIGGGAIGGAIIGGILGGGKGAAIGGSAGAGAGTAAVLAGGRNAATLAAGTPISIRLTSPAIVTVSR